MLFQRFENVANCMRPRVRELYGLRTLHSKWSMHVWEEGKGPPLGSAPPAFHLTGSRESKNMDNPGDGASLQSGRFAVGSGYQQSEHIVL
jgi:hypothetical protein